MKVLWSKGPLSARETHELLGVEKAWSASTTRTFLDRLVKKGMLGKESFHGLNLYKTAISKAAGLAHLVRFFAENVLETKLDPVVNLFAGSDALSRDELEELQAILDMDVEEKSP